MRSLQNMDIKKDITMKPEQAKRFNTLDNATKALIRTSIDKLADDIVESIYTAQCEQDSPNGQGFWKECEDIGDVAQEYMIAVAKGEIDV